MAVETVTMSTAVVFARITTTVLLIVVAVVAESSLATTTVTRIVSVSTIQDVSSAGVRFAE